MIHQAFPLLDTKPRSVPVALSQTIFAGRVTKGFRYREIRAWFERYHERKFLAQYFFNSYAEEVVEVNGMIQRSNFKQLWGFETKEQGSLSR